MIRRMLERAVCVFAVFLAAVLLSASWESAAANTWTQVAAMPSPLTRPRVVVVDPSSSSIVYVIDYDPGISRDVLRKSVDGGTSWSTVFTPATSPTVIAAVAVDPATPSTLYLGVTGTAGGGAAFYKSTDAGAHWTLSNFGLVQDYPYSTSIAFAPGNSSVLYVITSGGVYKSSNGAGSWSLALNATGLTQVAVAPSNADKVYAVAYDKFYTSGDAGGTWTSVAFSAPGAQGSPANLVVDPTDPSILYINMRNAGVYKSTDSGATWVASSSGLAGCGSASQSVQDLLLLPGSRDTLFVGTMCGVFRSLDGARSWTDASAGLPPTTYSWGQIPATITSIASSAANPNLLYAAGLTYDQNGLAGGGLFRYTHDASVLPPTCSLTATPTVVAEGGSATLTAYCSPAATSYTWSANSGLGSTASSGTVFPSQTTTYTVQGFNANGASNVASATVLAPSPRLTGISTRGQVLTGDGVLIAGIAIGGSVPKTVAIRARGPSLNVAGALADPTLTLYGVPGGLANDDWQSAPNAAALASSGFAPSNPKEAALLVTLNPGAYTVVVSGVGNTTGLAIAEAFEVDHPEMPLIGISTRGSVQGGDNVLIGGFAISGNAPQTVVVRARGPSLPGIANPLPNPTLQVVSDQGVIATNDDWMSAPNAADIQAAGFAPANSSESAVMLTLNPGLYTAIVSGVSGGGIGIVEVFAR